MSKIRKLSTAMIVLIVAPTLQAQAEGLSVSMVTGFSTLNLSAGSTFQEDGGIGLELRPQLNFEFPSLNAAIDTFFQGRIGSNFGSFPVTRIGGGITYYPSGLALQTTLLDNGVTMVDNHFAPFILAQVAFAAIAVTDSTSVQPLSFNGSAIAYQLGGGLELPMGQDSSILFELIYEGVMVGGASSGSGSTSSTGITYNMFSGLVGFSIHR